jgi:hypothetical protein
MLALRLVFQRKSGVHIVGRPARWAKATERTLDMKMTRLTVFLVALLTPLVMTQGVATASLLTYDYSGTFDMGPLSGTSFTGTFSYDTAGNANLQTNIPLTFSLFSNYDTRQIEAHPSMIPLFTLVDGRQNGGFSLHISIVHFVSPELDQPLPPIQFASVFFSPDPNFSVVSVDNDTLIELAPVPEPGTLLLLASGLAGLVGARIRRRA